MTYQASLRFGSLGHIQMVFGDVCLSPGVGAHRLVLQVQVGWDVVGP